MINRRLKSFIATFVLKEVLIIDWDIYCLMLMLNLSYNRVSRKMNNKKKTMKKSVDKKPVIKVDYNIDKSVFDEIKKRRNENVTHNFNKVLNDIIEHCDTVIDQGFLTQCEIIVVLDLVKQEFNDRIRGYRFVQPTDDNDDEDE